MNLNGVFHAAGVAAGQRRCDRNAAAPRFLEHAAVALFQPGLAERKTAELVLTVRIGTADVKKNVRLKLVQGVLDGWNQRA